MLYEFPAGLDAMSSNSRWADWIELALLFGNSETMSKSDAAEALELYVDDLDEIEVIIDDAFSELRTRRNLLGDEYPLRTSETYVGRSSSWHQHLCFSFLLAVSTHEFYEETRLNDGDWHEPAILFEHIVTAVLRRYLNGRAIRVGSPREPPAPPAFEDCLPYIASLTTELALRPRNPDVRGGDEGCDVVAWVPFVDDRPSQAIVLAQCGIGKHWRSKLYDLSLDLWGKQMDWHAPATKAFAFPFWLDEEADKWEYFADKGGILFDRLRLNSLARDADLESSVVQRIEIWCDQFAQKLPVTE